MNRHISYQATLFALVLTLLAGCTHNNGDIGPLFGKWKVTAIEADGTAQPDYRGNVFWSFQSHTVEVTAVFDHHERYDGFGCWSMAGDELILSFPDSDRQPPEQAALPSECTMTVLRLNSKNAVFRYLLPEGGSLTYTLTKW